MSELPRRRLLAVAGTALTGAVAGCSSSDDDDEENGDDDLEEGDTESETEIDGTTLGEITIDNLNNSSHSVDVIVEFDGEIEEWVTESLDADSGVTLERNWPSDPGEFRVTARIDQDELIETTSESRSDSDCFNLFVRINREGELAFLSNTDAGPCGDGDVDLEDAD